MSLVAQACPETVPVTVACRALDLNRSSIYERRRRDSNDDLSRRSRRHCPQPRALSEAERSHVRDVLYGDEFIDQPPQEIYQRLLQRGEHLCSISTMYRLLKADGGARERRHQRPAQNHAVPRIVAEAPNEAWTWDITKCPTIARGQYLSLYVVMDLFSRFVLAWMISRKENSALAQQLMDEALQRYRIGAGQLVVHQDRGAPMIARAYLDLMGEHGVTCSHSRPRVSNDNPFSESQFKTAKYQPDYPGRFDSVSHARQWYEQYFDWYNFEHHHSGLGGYTPEQVFTGRYRELAVIRQQALDERYEAHPERFVKGRPVASQPPAKVAINPITEQQAINDDCSGSVNMPTLPYAWQALENAH